MVFLAMLVNYLICSLPNLIPTLFKQIKCMVCEPVYIRIKSDLDKLKSGLIILYSIKEYIIYTSTIYIFSNDLIIFIIAISVPIIWRFAYLIIIKSLLYNDVTNLIKYIFTYRIWFSWIILPYLFYILFYIIILFTLAFITLKTGISIYSNINSNIIECLHNIQCLDKFLEDFSILKSSEPSSPMDSLNGSGGSPGYPGGSPSPVGYENAMVLSSIDEDRNRFTSSPVEQPGGLLNNVNGSRVLSIRPNGYSISDVDRLSNVSLTSNMNIGNGLNMNMEVRRYLNITNSLLNVISSDSTGFRIPQILEPSYITHNMVGYISRPDGGFMSVFNHIGLFTRPLYYVNLSNGVSEYVELGLHYRFIPVNSMYTYICEVTYPNGHVTNYVNFETFLTNLLDHKALMIHHIPWINLSEEISSVVENVNRFIENSLRINNSPAPYVIRYYSNCL